MRKRRGVKQEVWPSVRELPFEETQNLRLPIIEEDGRNYIIEDLRNILEKFFLVYPGVEITF